MTRIKEHRSFRSGEPLAAMVSVGMTRHGRTPSRTWSNIRIHIEIFRCSPCEFSTFQILIHHLFQIVYYYLLVCHCRLCDCHCHCRTATQRHSIYTYIYIYECMFCNFIFFESFQSVCIRQFALYRRRRRRRHLGLLAVLSVSPVGVPSPWFMCVFACVLLLRMHIAAMRVCVLANSAAFIWRIRTKNHSFFLMGTEHLLGLAQFLRFVAAHHSTHSHSHSISLFLFCILFSTKQFAAPAIYVYGFASTFFLHFFSFIFVS